MTSTPGHYILTLVGAPRNLRIGAVTTMVYMIKLRNIFTDTTNVRVTDTLPEGLQFSESVPPPTSVNGGVLIFTFATLPANATQMILIKAELAPTALAGASLADTTTVTDNQGNTAQASFTGGVRAGVVRTLQLDISSVRQILTGSKLQYFIAINNPNRTASKNVVLTVDTPPQTDFVSASPGPSSAGGSHFVFNLGMINGPGKAIVRLTQRVQSGVAAGTVLTLNASVTDSSGLAESVTRSVTVRD